MKKITTYLLFENDEEIIQSIATLSSTDKILNFQVFDKSILSTETHFAYDEKEHLIEKTEEITTGGTTTIRYKFDEKDEVIATQTYYGADLYEEQKLEYLEDKSIKTTFQDGKIIEKIIESEKEDGSEELLVYDENDKLLQKQVTIAYENATEITISDGDGKLVGLSVEFFDENDELKEKKEYDENKNLIRIDRYTTENGLVTQHYIKTKVDNEVLELNNLYQYDENENEIAKEVNMPNGQSLVLESKKYNSNNEIIEEIYENLSGNMGYGTSYHKIYKIEEV